MGAATRAMGQMIMMNGKSFLSTCPNLCFTHFSCFRHIAKRHLNKTSCQPTGGEAGSLEDSLD